MEKMIKEIIKVGAIIEQKKLSKKEKDKKAYSDFMVNVNK